MNWDEPLPEREERVDNADFGHLGRVLRKWRVLIAAGVLFAVAVTFALLRLTTPDYRAETVLLFDQPALVATGEQGLAASQKLSNLMPTYARVATSDVVMAKVRETTGTSESVEQLRGRVDAEQVTDTLALRITVDHGNREAAERTTAAVAQGLRDVLGDLQADSDVPDDLEFVITPLLEPDAERPARDEPRTLLLVGLVALIVMAGVALLLEYVDRS